MAGTNREGFEAHLRARGDDDATVEAYLRIAERVVEVAGGWVVSPRHVDEAIRRAEREGATPKQLANVKRVGDAMVAFVRSAAPPPTAATAPVTAGSTTTPTPTSVATDADTPLERQRCPSCGAEGTMLHFAPGERSALATQGVGGIGGLVGIVGVRLFGCFGVVTLMLAFGAAIALYRAVLLATICKACDHVIEGVEIGPALAADRTRARWKSFGAALALGAGAALAFVVWIGLAVSMQP